MNSSVKNKDWRLRHLTQREIDEYDALLLKKENKIILTIAEQGLLNGYDKFLNAMRLNDQQNLSCAITFLQEDKQQYNSKLQSNDGIKLNERLQVQQRPSLWKRIYDKCC